jgi:hypothetical protein
MLVHKVRKDNQSAFVCDVCDLSYRTRTLAEQCEAYCSTYGACSLDITKHTIEMQE